MRPGDEVRCSDCGAVASAHTTGTSAPWRDGDAVMLSWANGPYLRHTSIVGAAPARCLWCSDRMLGWPSVMARPLPHEAPWKVSGTFATYEIPPLAGPPKTEEEHAREVGRLKDRIATSARTGAPPPPDTSALERYEELAAAFRAETGLTAPGKDRAAAAGPGGIDDAELMRRWIAWCRQRAQAAQPSAPRSPPPATSTRRAAPPALEQGSLF
jgi:hypothetical protein